MYQIFIGHKIGDYIKDMHGKVYKLTDISMKIYFEESVMQDVATFEFTAVDARDPEGTFYVFKADQVEKASPLEVNMYVNGSSGESGVEAGLQEHPDSKHQERHTIRGLGSRKGNKPMMYKNKAVRTIDDMLDEINDYKLLIEMFGDDEGEYQKRIDEIFEELDKASKSQPK